MTLKKTSAIDGTRGKGFCAVGTTPFEISHPWRVETMVIGRTAAFRVPNPLRFTSREAANATRSYLMAEVYATSPDVVVRVEGPEA